MTSPLVNPAAGYSTLSRLDSSSSRPSTTTRIRSLIDDVLGGLVGPQAQEPREAQPPVSGAFGETQLHHHIWTYPDRGPRILARDRRPERRPVDPQGVEFAEEFLLG